MQQRWLQIAIYEAEGEPPYHAYIASNDEQITILGSINIFSIRQFITHLETQGWILSYDTFLRMGVREILWYRSSSLSW